MRPFVIGWQVPEALSNTFFSLSFYYSDWVISIFLASWVISIILASSSMILPSVPFIMLFSPSVKFYKIMLMYFSVLNGPFGSSLCLLFLFWDFLFLCCDFPLFNLFQMCSQLLLEAFFLMRTDLKLLSNNSNISVCLVQASIDYLFCCMFCMRSSWCSEWVMKTWTLWILCYGHLGYHTCILAGFLWLHPGRWRRMPPYHCVKWAEV